MERAAESRNMKTTHKQVLNNVTLENALLWMILAVLVGIKLGQIATEHRVDMVTVLRTPATIQWINKAFAEGQRVESTTTPRAIAPVRTASTTVTASTNRKNEAPPERLAPLATYTSLSERSMLRTALDPGIYELPNGRFVEVLGTIEMPLTGPRRAAQKFNRNVTDPARKADIDATEACNAPDSATGAYWQAMPDHTTPRHANVCRFTAIPEQLPAVGLAM